MIENPFKTNRDTPQHVSWKHFIDWEIYHVEFILPFNAIINEWGHEGGAYMSICAEVLEDHNLHVSTILKGQLIIIDIPIKTFNRSWICVNKVFREQFESGDNLRVKFRKRSKQDMSMIELEKFQPSPEQKAFADRIYADPDTYRSYKPIVRRTEEL
jgi:hypothetical protein